MSDLEGLRQELLACNNMWPAIGVLTNRLGMEAGQHLETLLLAAMHKFHVAAMRDGGKDVKAVKPLTVHSAETMLLLVFDTNDVPDISLCTPDELEAIGRWCSEMYAEASDNDVRASAAPECLRRLLPEAHYLQRWRLPR